MVVVRVSSRTICDTAAEYLSAEPAKSSTTSFIGGGGGGGGGFPSAALGSDEITVENQMITVENQMITKKR
jgi:hypothetical protein